MAANHGASPWVAAANHGEGRSGDVTVFRPPVKVFVRVLAAMT